MEVRRIKKGTQQNMVKRIQEINIPKCLNIKVVTININGLN